MRDQKILASRYKLNFRNSIKSLDELAQTDTLIMDDYFFLDNTFDMEGFEYVVGEQEAPLQLGLLVRVIEESALLKEHMLGHTIPINRYFRLNRPEGERGSRVKILKERLVDDSTIEIEVKVSYPKRPPEDQSNLSQPSIPINSSNQLGHHSEAFEELLRVRFSDKVIASTVSRIREGALKKRVNLLAGQAGERGSLVLFVDVMGVEGIELSMLKSVRYFTFHCLFCFSEESNRGALKLVSSERVLRKYNVAILTSKAEKYIKYWMGKGGLLGPGDNVISLEEKEEREMTHIIRNYRKTLGGKERSAEIGQKSTILFINSSMITYLSRRSIRRAIFKLSAYCKYMVFYGCSQYEKQISCINLFKIFPDHIFLSNYVCDSSILQYSHLSVSEAKASSAMLTHIVVGRFAQLEDIIFGEAIKSVQIVYCIINSCVFKNQLLLASHIACFLLVYQGGSTELGVSFVSEIYFFYNLVFTVLPIAYMILRRPDIYIDQDIKQYLNAHRAFWLNLRTILVGALTSYLIFTTQCAEFAPNVFTSLLLNCIVVGNLFLLFLGTAALTQTTPKTKKAWWR